MKKYIGIIIVTVIVYMTLLDIAEEFGTIYAIGITALIVFGFVNALELAIDTAIESREKLDDNQNN